MKMVMAMGCWAPCLLANVRSIAERAIAQCPAHTPKVAALLSRTITGRTLLFEAVANRDADMVQWLHARGVCMNGVGCFSNFGPWTMMMAGPSRPLVGSALYLALTFVPTMVPLLCNLGADPRPKALLRTNLHLYLKVQHKIPRHGSGAWQDWGRRRHWIVRCVHKVPPVRKVRKKSQHTFLHPRAC